MRGVLGERRVFREAHEHMKAIESQFHSACNQKCLPLRKSYR